MGSTNSINGLLGNSSANYSSLAKLADGTYNKGEIVFEKGFLGGFEKVNNHVGALRGWNDRIQSASQNRVTNAAVFKAIITRFGGADKKEEIDAVLSMNTRTEKDEIESRLSKFDNPFIKEAFKFLLADGGKNPLSRDEMKLLDKLLTKCARYDSYKDEKYVKAMMGDLEELRKFKSGRESFDGERAWRVKNLVTGDMVDKGLVERARAKGVTANQIALRLPSQIDKEENKNLRVQKHAVLTNKAISDRIAVNVARATEDVAEWNEENVERLAKKVSSGLGKEIIKYGLPISIPGSDMKKYAGNVTEVILDACAVAKPGAVAREFKSHLRDAIKKILDEKIDYHVGVYNGPICKKIYHKGTLVLPDDVLANDDGLENKNPNDTSLDISSDSILDGDVLAYDG